MTKKKKPLTCPVCKRKFSYSAKSNPMGRMSKHLWKEHKSYMMKKQKSGKKKAKSKGTQLERELQFTDDMILQSLMDAGIPLSMPQQPQMLNPYAPTQHQSIAGALITAYKLGQTAYTAYKGVRALGKAVKKVRKK